MKRKFVLKKCITCITSTLMVLSIGLSSNMYVYAYQDGSNTYEWKTEDGKQYWYENGERQGVYGSKGNVFYGGTERGREIYDRESDGWYWLDAVYSGAKAEEKEVFMPYIYSDEEGNINNQDWINGVAALSNKTREDVERNGGEVVDLSDQIRKAIECHGKDGAGKWVRYDKFGRMIKGWYRVQGNDVNIYPQQEGNIYYYDRQTGLMAKGNVTIDGVEYYFDEISGILKSEQIPDELAFKFSSDTDKSVTIDGVSRLDNSEYHIYSNTKELSGDLLPGDVVLFGKYEQDNNLTNGAEPIEWEVLKKDDGKVLLVSRYILDFLQNNSDSMKKRSSDNFNRQYQDNFCLREWLNKSFYYTVFSEDEQKRILTVANNYSDNSFYDLKLARKIDYDRVFPLNIDDIFDFYRFSGSDGTYYEHFSTQLIIDASPYAVSVHDSVCKEEHSITYEKQSYLFNYLGYPMEYNNKVGYRWWLRTPGVRGIGGIRIVEGYGGVGGYYSKPGTDEEIGVRPAIWISLNGEKSIYDSKMETENDYTIVDNITRLCNWDYIESYNYYEGTKELSDDIAVGDVVRLGSYEQDCLKNGKEPIAWEVLDIDNGTALLVSRYVIDAWDISPNENKSWNNSEVRNKLNQDFYDSAFNESEKTRIIESKNYTSVKDSEEGEYSEDRVFLLSIPEIKKYYGLETDEDNPHEYKSEQLYIDATPYSQREQSNKYYFHKSNNYLDPDSEKIELADGSQLSVNSSSWLLRDFCFCFDFDIYGEYKFMFKCINRGGFDDWSFDMLDDTYLLGIRPAIRVKL